jgi:hypothetical protein
MSVSATDILQGGSFSVTITDCLAIDDSGPDYSITVDSIGTIPFVAFATTSVSWGDVYSPTISESGMATGTFEATINTSGDPSATNVLHVLATDTITVGYSRAPTDTAIINVTPDPCLEAPEPPTGLTGVVHAGNQKVTLSWTAPSPLPSDHNGYVLYERVDGGAWFERLSFGAGVTTVVDLPDDFGKFNLYVYDFKLTSKDTCPLESVTDSNTWTDDH